MARQASQMPKDAVAIWRNGKTDADPRIAVTGKYMTFYARVRPSDHSGNAPLFAREDSTDPHGAIFTYANSNFQYIWRTLPAAEQMVPGTDVSKWSKAAQTGVLPIAAAVPKGEENQWHDLVMRFDCSKLTLFLDGVPMREEYPHGDLVGFTGPFRVGAGVETVAIWNRALTDEEITDLSGGALAVAAPQAVLGPKYPWPLQYWRLDGYTIWDPMPVFLDNSFHLFLGVQEPKEWYTSNLDNIWFWHMSSPNLVTWTMHSRAAEPRGVYSQLLPLMGTGNFIKRDDNYYGFLMEFASRPMKIPPPPSGASPALPIWTSH